MKISNVGRVGNRSGRAQRFGLTAVSSVALAAAMPSVAFAQAADAPPADAADSGEIVVTGIKYGIEQSLNLKRNELSIIEAVSAEEIGKLPDVSIAESISRLPGLAAQRIGGRAQTISIRGLGPDFATTLLNGRQQASSGDNRGVEFDQYPSELLSGVVIYKTPDADISGQGLSGTIDLRTVRPLGYGKRAIALNIRGERTSGKQLNDDVRNYGGRISASYIDQNESGTFGWAFGFAHLDAPSQNRHYKAYNYETFSGTFTGHNHTTPTDIKTFINPDSADNANFLSGQEIFAYSRLNKRDAGLAILEWEPSSSVHMTLDSYYSRFKQRETMRGAQWFDNPFLNFFGPGGAIGTPDEIFSNVGTSDYGGSLVATTGTVTNVAPIIRNDYNTRDDELFSIGLNNQFQMTEKLKFIADLSYSMNKRDESITETYAGAFSGATPTRNNTNYISDGVTAGRAFDTISWDLHGLNGFPTFTEGLNYADASRISLGDRDPWGGWGHDGQTKQPHVKENVYALDLGFEYDVDGFFDSFDLGVNFTKREKSKRVDEFDEFLLNNRAQVLVDPALLVSPTSLGYAGFGDVLAINLKEALPRYYNRSVFINNDTFNKAWAIDEEVITLRAKATVDTTLFGLGLRGNVGVQVVNQRQQSSGSAINATVTPRVVTPVNVSAAYTDVLPSMNLIYELGGGHRIRFAAAKVLARPRMDELRASFIPSFNVNICSGSQPCVPGQTVNPWSGTGGNAKLEPWRAKALDLAYEWYIDRASYISIAGFYKHLDNYIFTQRQAFDFSGLPIPPAALAPGKIPPGVIVSPIGQINQPANGKGGSIKGIELSGALEFKRITSLLDGFGVIGSYSYTKSNLHPLALNAAGNNQAAIQATRIPGLSGTVYTVTGYFEKAGFQARASYRYRSAFKGEVTQLFAVRGVTEILADKDVSAQIGYTFQEGSSLAGLGVLLQVNNLTDSRYATRLGTDGGGKISADGSFFLQDYEKYGRQFLFGVSYHF